MEPFEGLGSFYLGRVWDPQTRRVGEDLVLYDSSDLTTHAVCVGMTGSGKTGLGIALLEEAGLDSVPAIAIDPKGDLANLLLTFPELRPSDFRPWIDDAEAAREGLSPDAAAERAAKSWREGLAEWGQDGSRIVRLRKAVDLAVYTPGSDAGIPIAALRSLAAPAPAILDDEEALRERVGATSAGLLTLLGLDADPLQSRDAILVAKLLESIWRERRDADLATLIAAVREPPFGQVGVLDLETFYPARERFALAMALNNLLASPAFAGWLAGEPLDVGRLLWTPQAKPRIAVVSIAHLSEAERMFFVTLLLNEVVAWVRSQPGSSSLRAVLYMDEVFGFLPPVANPPSKRPLLTLLKQARASGLGVVLATQNPVDLDYKGLSNAGTWWLGRLQTERDKERVLEGLEGVAAASGRGLDRPAIDTALSGLAKRVFLMHNVHDDAPVLLHSRWALSYLRGPLTRAQLRALSRAVHEPAQAPPTPRATPPAGRPGRAPVLPPGIRQRFLASLPGQGGAGAERVWVPHLLGLARVHYVSARHGVDAWREVALLSPLAGELLDDRPWDTAIQVEPTALHDRAIEQLEEGFAALPRGSLDASRLGRWQKNLADHLYQKTPLVLWHAADAGASSVVGEDETSFRLRVALALRERRDAAVARLRARYAPKLARLADRVRAAEERVERERSQYGEQKLQTAISIGATVLGAMFGRKLASTGTIGRATTAARGAGRAGRERDELGQASERLEQARLELAELERSFAEETAVAAGAMLDPGALVLERLELAPRKADISAQPVELVWIESGGTAPAGSG